MEFNGVFIIPTGLGAEIGGHAGDANPAAKLIAAVCDNLIIHPNVVNASDINEMTENMLYVEGSILDRFLEGSIGLQKVHSNRILVAVNKPIMNETINAVSAARATIGADIEIVELDEPLVMLANKNDDGSAGGIVHGDRNLVTQVMEYNFDALAIHTPIDCPTDVSKAYFKDGGVNPWGGVEAIASKLIANALDKPVAHAPTENPEMKNFNEIVDPRMSAEMISASYFHCVLKGLWRAPRLLLMQNTLVKATKGGIVRDDMDFLITPDGCWGAPHEAAYGNMPIIVVTKNKTIQEKWLLDVTLNENEQIIKGNNIVFVENYLEAAGMLLAMKNGISKESVTRPLEKTVIY